MNNFENNGKLVENYEKYGKPWKASEDLWKLLKNNVVESFWKIMKNVEKTHGKLVGNYE